MDNPQPYQPLSQALQSLAPTTNRPHYPATSHHAAYTPHEVTEPQSHVQSQNARPHVEEEEEEEEDEDDDEGLVEEQLNQADADMHVSRPTTPKGPTSDPQSSIPQPTSQSTPPIAEKRRPGRPRGSKNRKPRVSAKNESQFYAGQQSSSATPAIAAFPSHPNITPQNQPYYEFQWRMLNLCAEFYGAAEELLKATSPLVVAQCYQLGPGVKVDPLSMLAEAKRVCDTLLANPSQLVTNPPPPVYPVIPTIPVYPPAMQPPITGPSTSVLPTTTAATPAASLVTTTTTGTSSVPSFVVPLNQPPYPQYPVYGSAPHAQYPTAPYYQYPTAYPYYPPPQPVGAPITNTSTSTGPIATTSTAITTAPTVNGAPWSEEESDRLKKLVEESKNRGSQAGKVDWEWVVGEWGSSRSKSQILRQATALNLKESTTRGTKRRREEGQTDVSGVSVTPSFQPSTSSPATTLPTGTTPAGIIPISSPDPSASHSTSTTTPGASPAIPSQQRPTSSAAVSAPSSATTTSTTAVQKMPWPMPTVAVQSAVPVLSTPTPTSGTGPSTTSSLGGHTHDQRSTYYRPRPASSNDTAQQQLQQQQQHHHHQSAHHYLFTPNGHGQAHAGIYRQNENGK